ncbi:DUF2333 family protein [Halomonas organivorans]|uniref:DUF2333 domain-containing protein n=1 Tax=Halomonas organivorans TaxID=257772 RepID=A0A7W5BVZ5_9GAMM|nr:DUF2333 family protein [Halomonas organivorans]MBB3140114.1 hypothetical protein [Halomonas organivorans]
MVLKRQASDRRRRRIEALERPQYGWLWKPLLAALVIYLLVALGLGIWWSRTPALESGQEASPAADAVPGTATLDGLSGLVVTLLDKPGGYLRNDLAPPGLWLDNMPAWELGVLSQARRLSQALPAMAGGDTAALGAVQMQLEGDSRDWFYPSTEHRLRQARAGLAAYREALSGGDDGFAAGGQGIAPWLVGVAQGLDDLGRRLSASVGSPEALADLDLEAEGLPRETPWYRVDNVFFEARGQTWALHRLLTAVGRDRAEWLEDAGLAARWGMLVAELERSQRRLWSPVVLNGSGFGIFANHSLVMANHVLRARDLSRELAKALPAAGGGEPAVPAGVVNEASGVPTQDAAAGEVDQAAGDAPASGDAMALPEAGGEH